MGISLFGTGSRGYKGQGARCCSPSAKPNAYGGSSITPMDCGRRIPIAAPLNHVDTVSPTPSPPRLTYIQHMGDIPYLIWPSEGWRSGGGGGGGILQVAGHLHLLQGARQPRFALRGGHLVPFFLFAAELPRQFTRVYLQCMIKAGTAVTQQS